MYSFAHRARPLKVPATVFDKRRIIIERGSEKKLYPISKPGNSLLRFTWLRLKWSIGESLSSALELMICGHLAYVQHHMSKICATGDD